MPKHEANDRDMGYFLPEDSQFRLVKLRDYLGFLSRLAQPRTADEAQEWGPEVRTEELAICLELLEEQADMVLSEVSWLAAEQASAGERDDASDEAAEDDAESDADDEDDADADEAGHDAALDAADDGDTEAEAAGEGDAEPDAAPAYGAAGKRLVFGLTLDQSDALDRLVRTISAHGNVLTMEELTELTDGTVPTLGDAIYDAAAAMREILDQVSAQRLGAKPRPRSGVCEEQAVYAVERTPAGADAPSMPALPVPAHRPPANAGRADRARLH